VTSGATKRSIALTGPADVVEVGKTPIDLWRNLSKLGRCPPGTIHNYADVLKRERTDPWKGYFNVEQVLPLEKLRGG
jgi:hypothetical protein